jgi:hypothetical protein
MRKIIVIITVVALIVSVVASGAVMFFEPAVTSTETTDINTLSESSTAP